MCLFILRALANKNGHRGSNPDGFGFVSTFRQANYQHLLPMTFISPQTDPPRRVSVTFNHLTIVSTLEARITVVFSLAP